MIGMTVCVFDLSMNAQSLSRVKLFATTWTVVRQSPLSMGFSRQEYWSGSSFTPPGDLPAPEIKLRSPESPALHISETLGKPYFTCKVCLTQVSLICIEHWNDKQLLSSFLVFFQIPTKRFIFAVFTHALNDICLSPVNWVTFYCWLYFPQISSSPFLWQVSLHSKCKNWFSWFSSTFSSLGKI